MGAGHITKTRITYSGLVRCSAVSWTLFLFISRSITLTALLSFYQFVGVPDACCYFVSLSLILMVPLQNKENCCWGARYVKLCRTKTRDNNDRSLSPVLTASTSAAASNLANSISSCRRSSVQSLPCLPSAVRRHATGATTCTVHSGRDMNLEPYTDTSTRTSLHRPHASFAVFDCAHTLAAVSLDRVMPPSSITL